MVAWIKRLKRVKQVKNKMQENIFDVGVRKDFLSTKGKHKQ